MTIPKTDVVICDYARRCARRKECYQGQPHKRMFACMLVCPIHSKQCQDTKKRTVTYKLNDKGDFIDPHIKFTN
jgi:hypothetical protein